LSHQVDGILENIRLKDTDLDKFIYLREVATTNNDLYYSALINNVEELMPIVYTPTVGAACLNHSHITTPSQKPTPSSGLYVTLDDLGSVPKVLDTWPHQNVSCVVVTDGERILGLGDLGANGLPIPIGKLALYSACAGINPAECLPLCVDVGTENEALLKDPRYVGRRKRRERGHKYDELIDEVVTSLKEKYGDKVLIQFEDFGNSNAFRLLRKYEETCCCFNDDIQGTASVVLAGLIASKAITGKELSDHTFLFLGAGEAGAGIADLIAFAIESDTGCSPEEARKNIWLYDSKGLVVAGRMKELAHHKQPFAHESPPRATFLECCDALNPSAIIGVSAQPGTFTRSVVESVSNSHANPIVFALSNPTSKAECTASEAYEWSGGRALFASGSPFEAVALSDAAVQRTFSREDRPYRYGSNVRVPGQGNNAYVFPGIGLGVLAAKAERVTKKDMLVAAKALAGMVSQKDIKVGRVYPELGGIRDISKAIAKEIVKEKGGDVGEVEKMVWSP